jgi:predicted nucleotidyltransferase
MELERFVAMGLLYREQVARKVVYGRTANPEWRALTALMSRYGALFVLQELFAPIEGLRAAFVFGSTAKGTERADSDIDLLLYGDNEAELTVASAIFDAASILDRQLDTKWYNRERFLAHMQEGVSFLPTALQGPKIWIKGNGHSLPRARE